MHPIDALGRPIGLSWLILGVSWFLWRIAVRMVTDYRQVRARRARLALMHAATLERIAAADRERARR